MQRPYRVSMLMFAWLLAGCSNSPNVLAPQGPAAAHIATLAWVLFTIATLVYLLVVTFLLLGLFRRRGQQPDPDRKRLDERFIVWAGIVAPAIVLLLVFVFTVGTIRAISAPAIPEEMTIEVTGHQWWWEVHYPHQDVITANEIHIPVGQPVRIHLRSAQVVHNFWVPELHGKMDLVPGQTNTFWLQADHPGEYWGVCAEFCGLQHANMRFVVVAEAEADFTQWLERQQQPASPPTDEVTRQGQQLFLGASCVYCHAIAGTNAKARVGPDLTHFASRRTLAAGAAPNNIGNLASWITNPHYIKPGNLMPAANLSGEELQALLAYLQSLN